MNACIPDYFMRPSDSNLLTLPWICHGFFSSECRDLSCLVANRTKVTALVGGNAYDRDRERLPYARIEFRVASARRGGLGTGLVKKIPLLLESGRFEGHHKLSRTTKHGATMLWAPAEYHLQCLMVGFCTVFPLVSVHRDGDSPM